ncbi:MAG: L-glyceraldehyde 3-phosphate reductase [Kiritimatiellae bacterium]|nr:L-glyceraldehyde 3-phosphate reductase [Kiritimatiellia bacterium]
MNWTPDPKRYKDITYNRCGRSGLMLPPLSLGLWHNFGDVDDFDTAKAMIRFAFDSGITHFDLANNYGPSPGSAEQNFGRILKEDFGSLRDELVISSKAGYEMWPGPYGNFGSRKYLIASLDQSLQRMGLDYVDIFYSHRFDPDTPLEETIGALDHVVRQGKALYAGISSYSAEQTEDALAIFKKLGTPCLIHQPSYSMLNRWIDDGLTDTLLKHKLGCIVFCPLAQGLLTDKYLNGIPDNSRAAKSHTALNKDRITPELAKLRKLNNLAMERKQSLACMALAWVLKNPAVTSAVIGASSVEQIRDSLNFRKNADFTEKELKQIDMILE